MAIQFVRISPTYYISTSLDLERIRQSVTNSKPISKLIVIFSNLFTHIDDDDDDVPFHSIESFTCAR